MNPASKRSAPKPRGRIVPAPIAGATSVVSLTRTPPSRHWRSTDSMKKALGETDRRRAIQEAYNQANGITPESIVRPLEMSLAGIVAADYADLTGEAEG